jgi:hypothetical protein
MNEFRFAASWMANQKGVCADVGNEIDDEYDRKQDPENAVRLGSQQPCENQAAAQLYERGRAIGEGRGK